MAKLFSRYLFVVELVSRTLWGRIGTILSTAVFFVFFTMETLSLMGIFHNTYVGILTYAVLPALWLLGLVLIDISLRTQGHPFWKTIAIIWTGEGSKDVSEGFKQTVIPTLLLLTAINVMFIVIVSSRTLHFMDQSEFCGTACHAVMGPEWTVYQGSPHSRVACVECHIGEGVQAFVQAKVNGAWQVLATSFDLYHKPIETPIHNLRPARETCEHCHWPSKFYGSRLVRIQRFLPDSANTRQFTTLSLKIDSEHDVGMGIHWHIAEENEVRYTSLDDKRETMLTVEYQHESGETHTYTNTRLEEPHPEQELEFRSMDCVDCHNRATHVYEQPGEALDLRMARGEIDTSIPYFKREALAVITQDYENQEVASAEIAAHLESFYVRDTVTAPAEEALARSIEAVKDIYNRNVHPGMKIGWGTYYDHIGHELQEECQACHTIQEDESDSGCFRCHNSYMQDANGNSIRNDCTLCHSILAFRNEDPLHFLGNHDPTLFEEHASRYFRDEYLRDLR